MQDLQCVIQRTCIVLPAPDVRPCPRAVVTCLNQRLTRRTKKSKHVPMQPRLISHVAPEPCQERPPVLDLFSGIGGLSLGLHWAGLQTVAFCEADPFARQILARHWPGVPTYPDIRTLSAAWLQADGVPRPWLVCGGFPCQDSSLAGRGAGMAGARTGLWSHMARLVAELRPRWVVAENVPSLRGRGADRVLLDLEAVGYAGWLVAQAVAADAGGAGLEMGQRGAAGPPAGLPVERRGGWPAEPGLRRVDDGLPAGLDRVGRLKALGNAVVPANAAMVGRALLAVGR